MKSFNYLLTHVLFTLILLLVSCGKSEEQQPVVTLDEVSNFIIQSQSITSSSLGFLSKNAFGVLQSNTPSDFKICVKRIRLEDDLGRIVTKDTEKVLTISNSNRGSSNSRDSLNSEEKGRGEIVFSPGLVDLTDPEQKTWGEVELPVGFKLKRIRVKVKRDRELCGVDYSLSYKGRTTSQDIELKWKFEAGAELTAENSTLRLSLDSLVENLNKSIEEGRLHSLKGSVEEVEDAFKLE